MRCATARERAPGGLEAGTLSRGLFVVLWPYKDRDVLVQSNLIYIKEIDFYNLTF